MRITLQEEFAQAHHSELLSHERYLIPGRNAELQLKKIEPKNGMNPPVVDKFYYLKAMLGIVYIKLNFTWT